MLPFVGVALQICQEMEIMDKASQGIIMKFAKIYSPEKMGVIMRHAKTYSWWGSNPKVAFMKAVGEVNKIEKEGTWSQENLY